MTVQALLLVVTTLVALVAMVVAIVAVRAVKRLSAQGAGQAVVEAAATAVGAGAPPDCGGLHTTSDVRGFEGDCVATSTTDRAPRVVQGRVIVPPTQAQVVRTALGRPGVRLSVLAHGLARALRPENRDRIVALMRREYRHRRRERLSAGRQVIRMARPTSAPSTQRMHAEFMEPRRPSLADRMINS